MATLREVQLALQEKIEELRRKDELIDDLEYELIVKQSTVDRLRGQLAKYRVLVKRLSLLNKDQQVKCVNKPIVTVHHVQQQTETPSPPPQPQQLPLQELVQQNHCAKETTCMVNSQFAVVTSTPVKVAEPKKARHRLIKLHSVNEIKLEKPTDNNNSPPALSSAAKKRLSFVTDKTKVLGGSESPLFMRFKKF